MSGKPHAVHMWNLWKVHLHRERFADNEELAVYLKKNKGKRCKKMAPEFAVKEYVEYPNTQVRKLTESEIEMYMRERLK